MYHKRWIWFKSYVDQVRGSSYLSDQYKTYVDDLQSCLRHGRSKNDQACEHHRQSVYEDVCLLLDHPNFSDVFASTFSESDLVPFVKSIYVASIRKGSLCHWDFVISKEQNIGAFYSESFKSGVIKTFGRPFKYKFDQNLTPWFLNGLQNKFSITTFNNGMNETVVSLTELISQGTEKRFIFGMDFQPAFLGKMIANSCLHHFESENCDLFRSDGSSVTHADEAYLADISPSTYHELKINESLEDNFCIGDGKIYKKTKFNTSSASNSIFTEIIAGKLPYFCDLKKNVSHF